MKKYLLNYGIKIRNIYFFQGCAFIGHKTYIYYFIRFKWERFISFNKEHPLNIKLISFTFSVLKLERFISFNDEHPQNIRFILTILLVLKLDKLISLNEEQL